MELSSVGLAFKGGHVPATKVINALEPLYTILKELSDKRALDEKLAEYAFFPLTHVFNDSKRLPARCLELAFLCLELLVAHGWRQKLSPALGKQLIILLTLIVGGSPNKVDGKEPLTPQVPEELSIVGFRCLRLICDMLDGPVAEQTIFHEIGTATVIDQTIYLLLEALVDDRSDEVGLSAANALMALFRRISDRVVLASVMPRTVSALAKVIKPSTQVRRSYNLLRASLQILTRLLKFVLNDRATADTAEAQANTADSQSGALVLDKSWLKATTTQIKLALVNIIQVRRHQRPEVQSALLELCVMVIENCQVTLEDAVPLMTDTMVVLADKEGEEQNEAYDTLIHLATIYSVVLDSLKESLHNWLLSFPRIMQGNDETVKQWGLRQISTAYEVISKVQSVSSEVLTNNLAAGLCNSVNSVVKANKNVTPSGAPIYPGISIQDVMGPSSPSMEFAPVLLEHQSQQQTLKDLKTMVIRLNLNESGNEITRLIVNRLRTESDDNVLSPFWLALTSLRAQKQSMAFFGDFVVDDSSDPSASSCASMIDELYYISLLILDERTTSGSRNWRTLALALEAVALQATHLGEAFRSELMTALYPTLQLLASDNPELQNHAMTCLNILTKACNYPNTSTMIIENVDYLTNSVSLKLNLFDVAPHAPHVLFMMVKICGSRLIPYLDDVVDSIIGIIDLYHGYPKMVEILFKCLAAIVEAGAQKPSLLTIDDGRKDGPHDHRKPMREPLAMSTVAANIASRKFKRLEHDKAETEMDVDGKIPHPKKPWSETYEKPPPEPETVEELLNKAQSDEQLPPPKEPEDAEKPLSKTHSLLLHIVKSIPPHLSSPSGYLRSSLLNMLTNVLPVLSQNENSFLPLINDLWAPVASRVIAPSSLASEPSSTGLTPKTLTYHDPRAEEPLQPFQKEPFVMVEACKVIEAMCKGAGDFMASRIEPEFPRWERLYKSVWTQVRKNAEDLKERRGLKEREIGDKSTLTLSTFPPLAPIKLRLGEGFFTPHHGVWQALLSLFITVLTRVRLPLEMGDRICEILGEWITLFVGPDYYFRPPPPSDEERADVQEMLGLVGDAIQAMKTWNADMTWFIFARELDRMQRLQSAGREVVEPTSVEIGGEVFTFAAVKF